MRTLAGDRVSTVRHRAFTLIELLVVVAIIAILISILLPALGSARKQARATYCGTGLNHVGKAVSTYLTENRSAFPFSYIYPYGAGQGYDPLNQPQAPDYGYIHWSWMLYGNGQVQDKAFTCPEFPKGGLPRTFPGPSQQDWEGDQQDPTGGTKDGAGPGSITDRQAPRCAFTANGAIMPRNKFTRELSGGQRVNRFVQEVEIKNPGDVILATEFNRNWRAAAEGERNGLAISKSHRPVSPFYHVGSGLDEYATETAGFIYGTTNDQVNYGLVSAQSLEGVENAFKAGYSELNAVGRHHPGGDRLGGTTNFLYVDAHVERKPILKTLEDREWGERFYSVTGDNRVLNRYGPLKW